MNAYEVRTLEDKDGEFYAVGIEGVAHHLLTSETNLKWEAKNFCDNENRNEIKRYAYPPVKASHLL